MDKGSIIIGGITIAVLAVIIGVAAMSPESKPAIGKDYANQGQEHIKIGVTHPPYNSNPPTSGWHYEQPAPWGVHTEALPDEAAVHNLEHGGIWISYNPDKVDKKTIEQLTNLTKSYKSKVILTPRKANETKIALASWTKLETLDSFDEAKIKDFIARNKNKGPEQVPDM
jgi:hypothetical protein